MAHTHTDRCDHCHQTGPVTRSRVLNGAYCRRCYKPLYTRHQARMARRHAVGATCKTRRRVELRKQGLCDRCGEERPLVKSKKVAGRFCPECYNGEYHREIRRERDRRLASRSHEWPPEQLATLETDFVTLPLDELLDKYAPRSWEAISRQARKHFGGLKRPPGLNHAQGERLSDAHHAAMCRKYFPTQAQDAPTHPALKELFG